jgi:hypothetical protein
MTTALHDENGKEKIAGAREEYGTDELAPSSRT